MIQTMFLFGAMASSRQHRKVDPLAQIQWLVRGKHSQPPRKTIRVRVDDRTGRVWTIRIREQHTCCKSGVRPYR
jgi:hypothetical protein